MAHPVRSRPSSSGISEWVSPSSCSRLPLLHVDQQAVRRPIKGHKLLLIVLTAVYAFAVNSWATCPYDGQEVSWTGTRRDKECGYLAPSPWFSVARHLYLDVGRSFPSGFRGRGLLRQFQPLGVTL